MENTLLQHYFLLKLRKAIGETVKGFWDDLDTYTTYKLLAWVNEIIEIEEDMRKNPEKYKNGSPSKPKIEEDVESLELYEQITGRREGDD